LSPWQIRIYEQDQLVYRTESPGPVEMGREAPGEARPYHARLKAGHCRIVLAQFDDHAVSREHLLAEPLPDGRARLINKSKKLPIRFPDGSELGPAGSRDMALPLTLRIGQRTVSIEPAEEAAAQLQSLSDATLPPGATPAAPSLFGTVAAAGVSTEALLRWLQAALGVLQSAASSPDFFDRAATALVDLVGLDSGRVLLHDRGQWRVQALKTAAVPYAGGASPADDRQPSRQVLDKVLQEKRTFWQVPTSAEGSLRGVNTLVAAPLLDRRGEVIGVLYGDRSQGEGTTWGAISRLEAMLVELLAGGVAAGLARLEHEQAALEGQKKLLQMERDLEIGRDIQTGFLPEELPRAAGWELAAHFRPAREVSGDFYDAFALGPDHLAVVIADVCNKGVGAALYMTLFRSLLRAFAQQTLGIGLFGWLKGQVPTSAGAAGRRRATLLADLAALSTVELTNKYVAQTHASAVMFATVFFGVLETTTGALTYVNAGHDAPALLGSAGLKARLAQTGPAVGFNPSAAYDINRAVLEPGDALLAYTDGVTEARNAAGEFFTEKRLLALLEAPARSAADLLAGVVAGLHEHSAGAEPSDDVTLLAVRRVPREA
jgi:sigma-B regulation protein RsbU (phosphoserine phosphatase)